MSVRRLAASLGLSLLAAVTAPAQATPLRRSLLGGQHIDGRCPPGFRRCLAFTFDDGPEIRTTPRLLDMLDAHRVRATFFVVGHRIDGDEPHHRAQRRLLREIARRGHLVGNHTYHHVVLGNLPPRQIAYEIDRTGDLIAQATGRRPELLRAPFGLLTAPRSLGAVAARNLTPAYWMIDTHDWEVTSAEAVRDRFRQELLEHPYGGVVLLHDTRPWSVRAFPLIMQVIARRNAELAARGEAPFAILNLDRFVAPRGSAPLRGAPLSLRRRHGGRPRGGGAPVAPR